jgi:hypothetical protein
MTTTTIAGHTVHVNDEGFLTERRNGTSGSRPPWQRGSGSS